MIDPNMMRSVFLFYVFFFCSGLCSGQKKTDPVLLSIDGEKITRSEFLRVYNKNNSQLSGIKSPSDYLDLFIHYKLKVHEAKRLGFDTLPNFRTEFENYKAQLAKPYLTDETVYEKLAQEAYARMKWEVHAAHILISLKNRALPEDTLLAWNKIMELRNRIVNGEDFINVARVSSDDKSAKETGGDLGYFTAFQMIYPFETVAYDTPAGTVSMPVRTRFGYHLIKVFDKRPAKEELHAAHIAIAVPPNASTQVEDSLHRLILGIYQQAIKGENFEKLALVWSTDQASRNNGGDIGWFNTGRMVKAFDTVAYSLKNVGDISLPVRTRYGWHIIKLLGKRPISSFDEAKNSIMQRIRTDERSLQPRQSVIDRVKRENNFREYPETYREFYILADTTIFSGRWKMKPAFKPGKTIFTLGKTNFTQKEFAEYLESEGRKQLKMPLKLAIDKFYAQWKDKCVLDFETNLLPNKNPEYKNLLQEYYEGILLFNITDRMVWSKAARDSIGLEAYYQKHKDKYQWQERTEARQFSSADSILLAKAHRIVMETQNLLAIDSLLCSDKPDISCINSDTLLVEKGENPLVDRSGILSAIEKQNGIWVFVYKTKTLSPSAKLLNEARGLYLSDYQSELEREWVAKLQKRYVININKKVLATICDKKK
jgi:peptidyl-prolyl cis-trans isomerase SurA